MADDRSPGSARQRKLKWPALDWLESLLMVLCGATADRFCTSVVCEHRDRAPSAHRWLWLQEVTSTSHLRHLHRCGGRSRAHTHHRILAARSADSFNCGSRLC